MKKSVKIVCCVSAAVVSVCIMISAVFISFKQQYRDAEQRIADAEYIVSTKENPVSVMKDALADGTEPVKAFYLGYDFENPKNYWETPEYSFHSELRSKDGELLAEYVPFLLLQGKTVNNKPDYRIILFDEEFTLTSKEVSGVEEEWKDNSYLFEVIGYYCSQAIEADGYDPSMGKPLEIYGTCDDTFIYVEKMVWYDEFDCVCTYKSKSPSAEKKGVPVDEWLNTLTDKKFVMQTENLPEYYGATDKTKEAKERCKEISAEYLNAGCDASFLEKRNDDKGLEVYAIERVEPLGEDYFVTSAIVFRPLQAIPAEAIVFCAFFAVSAIVSAALIFVVTKKRKKEGCVMKKFNSLSVEKKKRILKYSIGVAVSAIGLVVLPLLAEITPIGNFYGFDFLVLMGYMVMLASIVTGVFDIKLVFKLTYPVAVGVLYAISWAVAPVWDREWAILPIYTIVYMVVSFIGVSFGLLLCCIKKAIKKKQK